MAVIKPKYAYRVRLYQIIQEEGQEPRPGEVVDAYSFKAVGEVGAKRAATEWLNRRSSDPFDKVFQATWEYAKRCCYQVTHHGLLILSGEIEERNDELETLMASVRSDAASAMTRYGREKFLDGVARLAHHRMQQALRSQRFGCEAHPDRRALEDMNLLYDFPHASKTLAQALGIAPSDLSDWLAIEVDIRCQVCGYSNKKKRLSRQKGKYTAPCTRCNSRLEISVSKLKNVKFAALDPLLIIDGDDESEPGF